MGSAAVDDGGFFFGLATAPAHVEDKLDDAWLRFAKETPPKVEDDKTRLQNTEESSGQHEPSVTSQGPGSGSVEEITRGSERDLKTEPSTGERESDERDLPQNPNDDMSSSTGSGTPPMDEWEVITQGHEKGKASIEKFVESDSGTDEGGKKDTDEKTISKTEREDHSGSPVGEVESSSGVSTNQLQLRSGKGTTEDPLLQFNLAKKSKKLMKVAMEAMIRGYEKLVEDDKINVAAWHNAAKPEQRLRFWSDPDTEIKLAQGTNVQVFRMGIDWTRIMPVEPLNGIEQSVDWAALDRYRHIIERVRAYGMRVMLTLFHHSLPPWAGEYGGWKVEKTVDYFLEFARISMEKLSSLVDFWITFNEPHVFAMLTYCAGAWPGGHPDLPETATAILPEGVFNKVMHMMAIAHLKAYDIIHDFCKKENMRAKVGVSHHVSFMRPYGLFDISAVVLSDKMTRFPYIDDICHKLDFIGINYYGQEVVSAPGLKLVENAEYSESGRGVYPDGLYRVLVGFHERYKKYNIPYIITENGVSDATDYIRRPYILEHLLAIRAAMDNGVPVQGYCFWTTSDNWEWADGYGPKFGLVEVDRENDLKRRPRPSYYLFAEVAKTGKITKEQRDLAWAELQIAAAQGKKRPFCRAVDSNGLMYAGGLDAPVERPLVQRDWRFGHYQIDALQDPVSCLFRFLCRVLYIRGRSSDTSGRTFDFPYLETIPDATPSSILRTDRSETEEDAARELVAA